MRRGGFTPHLKADNNIAESNQLSSEGFTIIETLTTTLIFMTLIMTITGIFGQILKTQRRVSAAQAIQENMFFVIESISKEIRASKITTECDPPGPSCTTTTLTVVHPTTGTVIYTTAISNGATVVTREVDDGQGQSITTDLTSEDVSFTRFDFINRGLGLDCRQPKVTIVASVINRVGEVFQIDAQTTVTSRDLFDEFQNPQSPCP